LVFWLALLVQKVEILTPVGQDAFADHVHPLLFFFRRGFTSTKVEILTPAGQDAFADHVHPLPYVYEEMTHALLHRICPVKVSKAK
jgi:hypothetical protein